MGGMTLRDLKMSAHRVKADTKLNKSVLQLELQMALVPEERQPVGGPADAVGPADAAQGLETGRLLS